MFLKVLTMTVKELMDELVKLPADRRVVVQGYEDGFDDVSIIEPISVEKNPDDTWYYGRFVSASGVGEGAVLLFGRARSGV
jgi:hypothetical protein